MKIKVRCIILISIFFFTKGTEDIVMAGSQIEVSQTQLESQRYGYHSISLTNLGSTAEPQIAAGSKVEIGGALFNFAAPESITGWGGIGNDSVVWINLVVAGAAVTAVFTTTAPTWSTSKQGWYSGLDRYVAGLYKDGSALYAGKHLLEQRHTPFIRETPLFGFQAISLTNFDNENEPAIAAGSRVEIGGALYYFPAERAITGWGGIGLYTDAWIKLVPSGMSVAVEFTTTPPAWNHLKQGYYDGNDRYVGWMTKNVDGDCVLKHIVPNEQKAEMWFEDRVEIGDWDMDAPGAPPGGDYKNVKHYLSYNPQNGDIVPINCLIRNDSNTVFYSLQYAEPNDTEPQGGLGIAGAEVFYLARRIGGFFDNANYDSTGFNRGWVYFRHRARL